ncbi:hypothetical protein [Vibrio phage Va2]|nr:hypothetical protein [Vibrio phage Va2]
MDKTKMTRAERQARTDILIKEINNLSSERSKIEGEICDKKLELRSVCTHINARDSLEAWYCPDCGYDNY